MSTRLPDLIEFAKLHDLKIGTITDLIHYRSRTESLVQRVSERDIDTAHGRFRLVVYGDKIGQATHLALVGRKDLALQIAAAIRKRHDGERRNPWNEFECGSHYARALASYGLLLAWTGQRYDAQERSLSFSEEPFKGFWCVPGAWGTAERTPSGELAVTTLEGALEG